MSAVTAPRLVWIDLLRGAAVVGMVAIHVGNTFLSAEFDGTRWRQQMSFYGGLLAPAFLWIAGYLQGLAMRRAQQQGRPVVTWARLRRLGFIALIGYLMHVPWDRLFAGGFGAKELNVTLQADILPCMAVSLAMLLLVGLGRGWWLDAGAAAIAAFFVFAAPAAQHWHTGVVFVDAFLNHDGGSLFPLFPWVGFCAVGCLASRWEISWRTLLPTSLAFIALGTLLAPAAYSYVHPAFFAERLGWMGLIITVVWLAGKRFAFPWLQLAGRQSLLIYVLHLLLLYGIPYRGTMLHLWVGRTLSPAAAGAVFVTLLLVCLGLAWVNDRRQRRPRAG